MRPLLLAAVVLLGSSSAGAVAAADKEEPEFAMPQKTFATFVKALKDGDQPVMITCMATRKSEDYRQNAETYLKLWRHSFASRGGYDVKVVKVLDHHPDYPNQKDAQTAYLIFDRKVGDQLHLRLIKEAAGWKIDE